MELSDDARAWVEKSETLLAHADRDGIVCIPAVRGEQPAAERLLDILRTAYGSQWSDADPAQAPHRGGGRPGTSLDDWLRDNFFEQHCKRVPPPPVHLAHLGRPQGRLLLPGELPQARPQAAGNPHLSYLQDWITAQAAAAKDGKTGADLRLAAAQELQDKLKLILDGEPPYDIFVRWKPLHEQPIGWNPDLNDGVRVNIRPFMRPTCSARPRTSSGPRTAARSPSVTRTSFPGSGRTVRSQAIGSTMSI